MLKKDDPREQLVYYQVCRGRTIIGFRNSFPIKAGIGTYTIPQIAKPMMAKFHKALDSLVGIHLDAHVMGE